VCCVVLYCILYCVVAVREHIVFYYKSEDSVLRKIFRLKREKMLENRRMFHKEGFHSSYT